MLRPQKPTPELVDQYIQEFRLDAGMVDNTLAELFGHFPANIQIEHILLKVVTLNTLYSTGILAVVPVAEHIQRLHIDAKLALKAPELVNEIALVEVKEGKSRRFYSFASKYCSWHLPHVYPIYDTFVEKLIWKYQKLDGFSQFARQDLSDYPQYKRVIEDFREYYGLKDYSFKELDKFLWKYSKEYFNAKW